MTRAVRVLAATLVAGCAARGAPPPLSPEAARLAAELNEGSAAVEVAPGRAVPGDAGSLRRLAVAVPDPTRYFEAGLTQVLREVGVSVAGTTTPIGGPSDTLFVWQSLPLRELLPLFEKPSQNQIGEALLRTLGGEARGVASVDSGRATVRDVLRSFGVPDDAYFIADGSGVSHYDYVAPEVLARLLFSMGRRPDAEAFIQSLPVAGVDGTLAGRLRGTAAQGNARAKTGDISGARTLSGYVTTPDGERLVFVLMCNHFTMPRRVVDVAQDLVVERLANFRRGVGAGR